MKIDFNGIGTRWLIDVYSKDISHNLTEDLVKIVEDFENSYSRFQESSVLSKLNKEKTLVDPPADLIEMINTSEQLRVITKGGFDIRVGKRLIDLGYDANYSFKSKSSKYNKDNSSIEIENNLISISNETSLDLGGIGKGFLIDKVSRFLIGNGIHDFTINAGGDIYNYGKKRSFYLENPLNNTQAIGEITIHNSGIGCSATSKRNWASKSIKYHHLINLVTGEPAKDLAAVFTYADNALSADLASTAIFVSNSDLWQNISEYLNIKFMVVFSDGSFFKQEGYPGNIYA